MFLVNSKKQPYCSKKLYEKITDPNDKREFDYVMLFNLHFNT